MTSEANSWTDSPGSVLDLLDRARTAVEDLLKNSAPPLKLAGRIPEDLADLPPHTWLGWSARHAVVLTAVAEAGGELELGAFNAVLERLGYASRGRGGWWQGKLRALEKITVNGPSGSREAVRLTQVGEQEVGVFRRLFPDFRMTSS